MAAIFLLSLLSHDFRFFKNKTNPAVTKSFSSFRSLATFIFLFYFIYLFLKKLDFENSDVSALFGKKSEDRMNFLSFECGTMAMKPKLAKVAAGSERDY